MNNSTSRRSFIGKTTKSAIGALLLPTCLLNAGEVFAEESSSSLLGLASSADMRISSVKSKTLKIEGCLYDRNGLSKLSGVEIEVWHLNKHASNSMSKAKIKTDEKGRYQLITTYPCRGQNNKTPRIHFRILDKRGRYETELIVNEFSAFINDKHWELNRALGDKVFPEHRSIENSSSLTFNLSI